MRRLSLLCAAAAITVTALAAASPAQAAYHLIRWQDSGFCQIWGENVPTTPWPANYVVVSGQLPTFGDALIFKHDLMRSGTCSF